MLSREGTAEHCRWSCMLLTPQSIYYHHHHITSMFPQGLGGYIATGSHEGYSTPEEIKAKFDELAADNPDLAQVLSITKYVNASKTLGGREIYAIKVSANVQVDEDEPNFLFVSNHHARELVTPEVAMNAAVKLIELYKAGDDGAKQVMDNSQVYCIFTMNPDGLHSVWSGNTWQRANSRGVDLNRNYPVGWAPGHPSAYQGNCNGDGFPGSETYRGESPFSEVETHTMDLWQKDRHFAKVMDVHSNGHNVRINYGCHPLPTAIHNHQAHLGQRVAGAMGGGYPQGQSCCMGGDIHYSYARHGALSFLTELAGSGFSPASAERAQIVDDTWPGFFEFFKIPISVQGHVYEGTQVDPGDVIQAKVVVNKVPCDGANCGDYFTLGEYSETSEQGRYHLWLPDGDFEVTVTPLDGSDGVTATVTASEAGNTQDIYLGQSATGAAGGDPNSVSDVLTGTTSAASQSDEHIISTLDSAPNAKFGIPSGSM